MLSITKPFISFLLLALFSINSWADLAVCPGETVSELDTTDTPTSFSTSNTLPANTTHYYTFTSQTDISILVSSSMQALYNTLSIRTSCNSSDTLWEDSTNSYDKTSSAIEVSAGQTIVIAYERRYDNAKDYSLNIFLADAIFEGSRAFTIRNPEETRNLSGNLKVIGNTVLCYKKNGVCSDTNNANNQVSLSFIDVDSNNYEYDNSSRAQLADIPSGATVEWAAFYTQGYLQTTNTQTISKLTNTPAYLTTPNNTTIAVPPQEIDLIEYATNQFTYATYSEVPELKGLKGSEVNGWFTGANIKALEGDDAGALGFYGAWTLVIIYKDPSESFKNISVFDGYQSITKDATADENSISLSGFLTPLEGDVKSTVSIFVGEGDKNIVGDQINLDGINLTTGTNAFNSTVNGFETDPDPVNYQGIDIHSYEVGVDGDLSHPQVISTGTSSTTIGLTTSGDVYFPSMVAFTTELYVPDFCYDYAYKQLGQYFTEENDGTTPPRITGDILSSEDVEVKVFIRNLVASDVQVQNMVVDITDINTSQATYISNTTRLAESSQIDARPKPVSESDINSADSYIKNISINDMKANDNFYLYYKLNPSSSTLDMPLNVTLEYDLVFEGKVIQGYQTKIGDQEGQIPICSSSNFKYQPGKGIFNVVHNNFYDLDTGGENSYYNLPTQIVKRPGNFKIISLDPNNLDALNPVATMVSVEMIDVSAYHDTNTSCLEEDSAISEKVYIMLYSNSTENNEVNSTMFNQEALQTAINNNLVVPAISSPNDFYDYARENAAFRISYNLTNDGKDDLVKISEGKNLGQYKINFTELVQDLGQCAKDMDNNENSSDMVAQWCGNNSDKLTAEDVAVCMECIYGYNKRNICSRDNFAIRPEAIKLKLDDQTQGNISIQVPIIDESGKVSPQPYDGNLSAGYQYNLEAIAVNHFDNTPSQGYSKSLSNIDNDRSHYIWEPRSIITLNACNDENNITTPVRFNHGIVDTNTTAKQVGEYRLNLIDRSWTSVDHDPLYMTHHAGIYFKESSEANHKDCIVDSTISRPIDSIELNGCDISSAHINTEFQKIDETQQTVQYIDYYVTFHPYKFDLETIIPTVGLNNQAITPSSFVYVADISQDENMSVHLNGSIIAQGEDNSTLSNFVDGCFAKPLDISINRTNITLPVAYQYRFKTLDALNTIIRDTNATDLNNSVLPIQTQTMDFNKTLNGTMNTIMHLNYTRSTDNAINPQTITFNRYDVNCSIIADCTFNADLINNQIADGTKDLNTTTVRHYYGRSFTPRQSYTDFVGNAPIFYEAYCNINTGCNPTLLQGTDISKDGDSRWRINPNHSNNYGSAQNITQKHVNAVTADAPATGNLPDSTNLTYNNSRGRPYTATMQHNPDRWLIYNPYNANATTNEFQAEFIGGASSWAGKTKTSDTTETNASQRTNRRLVW